MAAAAAISLQDHARDSDAAAESSKEKGRKEEEDRGGGGARTEETNEAHVPGVRSTLDALNDDGDAGMLVSNHPGTPPSRRVDGTVSGGVPAMGDEGTNKSDEVLMGDAGDADDMGDVGESGTHDGDADDDDIGDGGLDGDDGPTSGLTADSTGVAATGDSAHQPRRPGLGREGGMVEGREGHQGRSCASCSTEARRRPGRTACCSRSGARCRRGCP